MYDPRLVQPMREELTALGVKELTSADEVNKNLKDLPGTALVVVNSVCGCAAGGARPGVAIAMEHNKKPDRFFTVFAGQDKEATDAARSYFLGYAPSSPSMALLKNGQVAFMLERRDIEGFSPQEIAAKLTAAFEEHC
ncbi:MAG: BrxA/BrxB family bacilliredoxin [Bdellovibrionales bacterium]|nr:BrxA/BrxB family bacilliredoxin [Bdellovibrionales bacterium]